MITNMADYYRAERYSHTLRSHLSRKEDNFTDYELRIQEFAFCQMCPFMPIFPYEINHIRKDGLAGGGGDPDDSGTFKLQPGYKIYGGSLGIKVFSGVHFQASLALLSFKPEPDRKAYPGDLEQEGAFFYLSGSFESWLDYLRELYEKLTTGEE